MKSYVKPGPTESAQEDKATLFVDDITQGDICIFLPGYFQLLHETRLSVASISTFMPGVRVVIATLPMYYSVFHG